MSLPIWTPAALRSEAGAFEGTAWRIVEAQHRVSTLKLVDSLDEQDLLEKLLEESKPPVPPECRSLDYLLSTPFRYRPYPAGSRFRRAGFTAGVWYGADAVETCVAELAFYRCLFYAESPEIPFPDDAAEYTAITARLRTPASIDLTIAPFSGDAVYWSHPTDYAACQSLVEVARAADIQVIRYASVRDPQRRTATAVLTCLAFARPAPVDRRTWRIRISDAGVQAIQDFPEKRLNFFPQSFAFDPRIAAMNWRRGGRSSS
ncbi:MAG: RES family NAD+ phosphorylase [Zavarzinia sp.]|nr:RES family NAD+ phosphorylase [Zavarzinia sp.]